MVAAGFGTIHGLAFSESLAGLSVANLMKAVAVLGFNIGVEGVRCRYWWRAVGRCFTGFA